jgi:AcrR family transcriptional regulator
MGRNSISDIRKPEILRHFYEVLTEEGLEGASLQKVADHMGVNKGLLLHYFNTKNELVEALVRDMTEIYEKTYEPLLAKITDHEERLNAILDALFDVNWGKHIGRRAYYACFYLGFGNAEIKSQFRKMFNKLKKYLTRQFKVFARAGIIKVEDPEKLAISIISLAEGLAFYQTIMGTDKKVEEVAASMRLVAMNLLKDGNGNDV